jgi:hypothetical protein
MVGMSMLWRGNIRGHVSGSMSWVRLWWRRWRSILISFDAIRDWEWIHVGHALTGHDLSHLREYDLAEAHDEQER